MPKGEAIEKQKKTVQSELKFSFLTNKSFSEISITPTKREVKLIKTKMNAKINVIKFCFEKFFIVQKNSNYFIISEKSTRFPLFFTSLWNFPCSKTIVRSAYCATSGA